MNFAVDNQHFIKTRTVFNLMDALSITGGMTGVLLAMGAILNSIFQQSIFKKHITMQLYNILKNKEITKVKK